MRARARSREVLQEEKKAHAERLKEVREAQRNRAWRSSSRRGDRGINLELQLDLHADLSLFKRGELDYREPESCAAAAGAGT